VEGMDLEGGGLGWFGDLFFKLSVKKGSNTMEVRTLKTGFYKFLLPRSSLTTKPKVQGNAKFCLTNLSI
jgi:hypothetical protein